MTLRNLPIRRKLMAIILITSVVVMLLMRGVFFTYEYLTFRSATVRQLSTLGEILADNSTAALAFENHEDAKEILSALKAERHVVAAALYDQQGQLFVRYPEALADDVVPAKPGRDGYRFVDTHLNGFQPVVQKGHRLGTLYLDFDTGLMMRDWIAGSVELGFAVMGVILLIAYLLSRALQKQISQPILMLAETARAISVRGDYSVRAGTAGNDELGLLTEAFNRMLTQIQGQNAALKDSEERFRMMFENNPLPMWVFDLETLAFLSVNSAAIQHYGYSREEFLAMTIKDIRPPEDVTSLEKKISEGIPAYERPSTWSHRKKNGTIIQAEIASHELDFNRRRVRLVLVNDVTERLKAEKEIHRLNDELERRVAARTAQLEVTNKELEAFSYSVSHDLRAPLRHIDGFAGLLMKNAAATLDEKSRRYLTTISDAAHQMGRLIDDLLAFSRTGRAPLGIRQIDHAALVAEVIRDGRYGTEARPIEWQIASLPPVYADPALLRQVWVNLIENAVKYSGKMTKPRIEIGCQPATATSAAIFFIRDNGVGFDMKYADKLFGVFQRLHSNAEFEGTGIGLANAHRIIARHAGRIWAESRVGEGATFYFTLPALASS